MKSMIWGHGWNTMRIAPWGVDQIDLSAQDSAGMWTEVFIRSPDHALWLLGYVGEKVSSMRDMLADGSIRSWRDSDRLILELVAQKLADRQLLLFRKVMARAVSAPIVSAAPRANSSPSPVAATPSKAPSPRPAPISVRESPPIVVENDFASIKQDAQAETLRKAAVAGVPFCAVCEELKRRTGTANSQRQGA